MNVIELLTTIRTSTKQTKNTSKIIDLRGRLKTADHCGAILLFELNSLTYAFCSTAPRSPRLHGTSASAPAPRPNGPTAPQPHDPTAPRPHGPRPYDPTAPRPDDPTASRAPRPGDPHPHDLMAPRPQCQATWAKASRRTARLINVRADRQEQNKT